LIHNADHICAILNKKIEAPKTPRIGTVYTID
jgi:hypothetical protein